MNYRTNDKPPIRTLVVRNHGIGGPVALLVIAGGLFLNALSLAYVPLFGRGLPSQKLVLGLLALVAFGMACVLAYFAHVGLRRRTRLTIDGDRLIVDRADGRRREVALHDVKHVDLVEERGAEPMYYPRIVIEDGEPLLFEDVNLRSRKQYDAMVTSFETFLRGE